MKQNQATVLQHRKQMHHHHHSLSAHIIILNIFNMFHLAVYDIKARWLTLTHAALSNVKVVPYSITSTGLGADPSFLAVSLQVT